jgi:hypothetical protein
MAMVIDEEPPRMPSTLDEVMPKPDEVQDLQIVLREFPGDIKQGGEEDGYDTTTKDLAALGQVKFEALHNAMLGRSVLTGTLESVSSNGRKVVYEGTFLCDPHNEKPIMHGQGTRRNVDGSIYTGQWKNGFQDGHGEWRDAAEGAASESFIGEWKAGKKHGFGVYKFKNGDMYEGDWANGKFQDRGKYIYANGDEFQGIWENGLKKEGSFYFKDGRVSRRTWNKGVLLTCQDFDSRRKNYVPTITRDEVHAAERNALGTATYTGVVSPRGIPR